VSTSHWRAWEEKVIARNKLSRNARCPCGSGRKYKNCGWAKGFEWVETEAGTVYKSTPMTPEVRHGRGLVDAEKRCREAPDERCREALPAAHKAE